MPNKSQTARINGAKSKGPVTPAGRARASQNALKHGLRARQIVLPDENRGAWRELLRAYIDQFQPATPVEHALVETMAAAQWRLRRLLAMETSILDMDMFDRKDDEYVPQMTNVDRLARTFQQLANNQQVLHLLTRYESTLQRAYDKAFKQLHILRDQPPTHGPSGLGSFGNPANPPGGALGPTSSSWSHSSSSTGPERAPTHASVDPNRRRREGGLSSVPRCNKGQQKPVAREVIYSQL